MTHSKRKRPRGPRIRIIHNTNDLRRAIQDIRRNVVVSFDTETSGLDPFASGSWITSLGISTKKYEWCLPLQHPKGKLFNKPQLQKRMMRQVGKALAGRTVVAQNGKFDTKWVYAIYKLLWHVDHDTMLMHYNLNENKRHGLDVLAEEYYGAVPYDIPLKEKFGFGPLDRHCEYLGLDIYYTRKLYFTLRKELVKDKLTWQLYNKLTMPVARMYADAEIHGMYLDSKQAEKMRKYWTRKSDRSMGKLTRLCPSDNSWKDKATKTTMYGVNWNSPDQVAVVLFDNQGLKPISITPGGKRQVNEAVLLQLSKKNPIPQLILNYRGAGKNLSFIKSWQSKAINNRIHPNFKVHGTVTGRPSCENPNFQQTPRDKMMRCCFTAQPGYTLISADFSQVELRLVADASGDKAMTFAFQTGQDVHTNTVQTTMGIMKPDYGQRKAGKAINFGFIYGMWWKKFVDYARDNYDVGFTDQEAERIRLEFFRLYSGLKPWQEKQKRFARVHGYVRSKFGRKRRLSDAMRTDNTYEVGEAQRQAVNSPIQSCASDMNLAAAIEIHRDIPWDICRIVSTTHDEILAEVRDDKLMEVAQQIKSIMESSELVRELGIEFTIPIIAEVEAGAWGSGEELKGLT